MPRSGPTGQRTQRKNPASIGRLHARPRPTARPSHWPRSAIGSPNSRPAAQAASARPPSKTYANQIKGERRRGSNSMRGAASRFADAVEVLLRADKQRAVTGRVRGERLLPQLVLRDDLELRAG